MPLDVSNPGIGAIIASQRDFKKVDELLALRLKQIDIPSALIRDELLSNTNNDLPKNPILSIDNISIVAQNKNPVLAAPASCSRKIKTDEKFNENEYSPFKAIKKSSLGVFFKGVNFNTFYRVSQALGSDIPIIFTFSILKSYPKEGPKQQEAIEFIKKYMANASYGEDSAFNVDGLRFYSVANITPKTFARLLDISSALIENREHYLGIENKIGAQKTYQLFESMTRLSLYYPNSWELLISQLPTMVELIEKKYLYPKDIGHFFNVLLKNPLVFTLFYQHPKKFLDLCDQLSKVEHQEPRTQINTHKPLKFLLINNNLSLG